MKKLILLALGIGIALAFVGSYHIGHASGTAVNDYLKREYGFPFVSRSVPGPAAYECDYSPCPYLAKDEATAKSGQGVHALRFVGLFADSLLYGVIIFGLFVLSQRVRHANSRH